MLFPQNNAVSEKNYLHTLIIYKEWQVYHN